MSIMRAQERQYARREWHSWMEQPLNPFLGMAGQIDLGLNSKSEGHRLAQACILANAQLSHWKGYDRVFYSRDNNHYASRRASAPYWYTRDIVVAAVEELAEARLIINRKVNPSPNARYRSTIASGPNMVSGLKTVADLTIHAGAPVEVRDRKTKARKDLRRLPGSVRRSLDVMAEDVDEQNGLLVRTDVGLRGCPSPMPGLHAVGPVIIDTLGRRLRRIFSDDLNHGGRWYGGCWQNIPERKRRCLTINGENTVEVDFSACQIRLAYGVLGLPDPLRGKIRALVDAPDLYAVANIDRAVAKMAVLIMINARNERSAQRALAEKLRFEGVVNDGDNAFDAAAKALRAVVRHFADLEKLWFSDLGLRLQRIDGDICAMVQRALRRRGIPVLSVHDSFIAATIHEQDLEAEMERAFAWGMEQARENPISRKTRLSH